MRRRAVVLQSSLTLNLLTTTRVAPPSNASKWQMGFNSAFKGLIWPEGNIRPPKEVIADPVRNSGSSLMLHILDNKYSNTLVADKSTLLCSEKRCCKMLEMGWRGFLGSRTRMVWLVVSHLTFRLPHNKRVYFKVDAVPKTNDGPILGPRNVGLDGLSVWRPSRYELRHASTRRICVMTGI